MLLIFFIRLVNFPRGQGIIIGGSMGLRVPLASGPPLPTPTPVGPTLQQHYLRFRMFHGEEVTRENKDQKKPLYIAFLDVKSAVDVVSHASL